MGNMVLLCYVCLDHKPVPLSLFMTHPLVFKMKTTTSAINETGTSYPSRAQQKQELLALPWHLTSAQNFSEISADQFIVFSSVLWTIVCFVIILFCPLYPLYFDLQLLLTSLLSSVFFYLRKGNSGSLYKHNALYPHRNRH